MSSPLVMSATETNWPAVTAVPLSVKLPVVGNVVIFGYPQDWIRTLGKRIVKLHIKDFKFQKHEVAKWVPLREGEINWPEVYKALAEIGYTGSATVELDNGNEAYLREVNKRFDLIIAGK